MLDKVPPAYDPFAVKARLQMMGPLRSMCIFLRQEIDRIQKVLIEVFFLKIPFSRLLLQIIVLVRSTFKDLLLAIEGTIIMSEQLRDALDCIFDAKVPTIWLRGSWTSSTLGFWFSELLERNHQFYNWCFVVSTIHFKSRNKDFTGDPRCMSW